MFLPIETSFLIHFVWKRRHIASAHESPIVDAENLVSMVPAIELILDSAVVVDVI